MSKSDLNNLKQSVNTPAATTATTVTTAATATTATTAATDRSGLVETEMVLI